MKNIPNRVLLVDDDRPTNYLNQRILKLSNPESQVISVLNGYEALEYLRKVEKGEVIKPELIFLDINMPAMNGWEFLDEYEKLDHSLTGVIKIFILSTSSNELDIDKGLTHEFVLDFIKKPLSKDVLTDVINKHFYLA